MKNSYFILLSILLIFGTIKTFDILNCQKYDSDLVKCIQCEDGYDWNSQENKCVQKILWNSSFDFPTQNQRSIWQRNEDKDYSLSFKQQNLPRLLQELTTECQVFDPYDSSQCLICPSGYHPIDSTCQLIPKNCISYNKQSGQCLTCKQNYQLVQNICISKYCNQYSLETQKCLKCQIGYNLNQESMCLSLTKDRNCQLYGNDNFCMQCATYFFLQKSTGKCVPVSPLCRTHNKQGKCTTCYPGYSLILQTGLCQVSKLPYCKVQSASKSTCSQCKQGFFLTTNNICKPINSLCKEYNLIDGKCTSCYKGYQLSNGQCKIFIPDPYCKRFNQQLNICQQCIEKYYLKGQNCVMVSPLCKNYEKLSGECTQCYSGYKLISGNCMISYEVLQSNIISHCKFIKNDLCSQCEYGYFINSTGQCQQVSKSCKTYNPQNGQCLTCYSGYVLVNNTFCQIEQLINQNKDPNCISFINSTTCQKCNKNYFIDSGKCKKVDELCKTFNTKNGSCLSCYNLYVLNNGKCQFMLSIFQQSSKDINSIKTSQQIVIFSGSRDVNCVKYKLGTCIECSIGFYLSSNKACIQLDPLCKSHNLTNGQCLSCYQGYVLNNTSKKCEIIKQFTIPFCHTVNSMTQFCDGCMFGYYLAPTMTECLPMSILCTKYDMQTGQCYECISGYVLQDGQCLYPALGIDWNCLNYDQGFCKKCKGGYQLFVYRCIQIISTSKS